MLSVVAEGSACRVRRLRVLSLREGDFGGLSKKNIPALRMQDRGGRNRNCPRRRFRFNNRKKTYPMAEVHAELREIRTEKDVPLGQVGGPLSSGHSTEYMEHL